MHKTKTNNKTQNYDFTNWKHNVRRGNCLKCLAKSIYRLLVTCILRDETIIIIKKKQTKKKHSKKQNTVYTYWKTIYDLKSNLKKMLDETNR